MTDIKPMLAVASTGASNRAPVAIESLAGTHVFDLKVDGVRAILYREPVVRLVNRAGVDITAKFPEIVAQVRAGGVPLDGEIFADDNSFETTLTRDRQERKASIARMALSHPCRFVAFDLPGDTTSPWTERRKQLDKEVRWTYLYATDPRRLTVSPWSDDPEFFDHVRDQGMEGVVAKRKMSRYRPGKRSPDWIKFKTVRRVTAIVAGYQPGHGSRRHFGNMQLVMLDADHNPVDVGTVGSGFTDRKTHELKALLDAGQILCVEIEALNVTSGRKLRHPVYKGIRSDMSPLDCTIDQLDTLPTC